MRTGEFPRFLYCIRKLFLRIVQSLGQGNLRTLGQCFAAGRIPLVQAPSLSLEFFCTLLHRGQGFLRFLFGQERFSGPRPTALS